MTSYEWYAQKKKEALTRIIAMDYNDVLYVGLDRSLTNTGIALVSGQTLIHKDVFGSKLYGIERLKDLSSQVIMLIHKHQSDFSKVFVITENYAFGRINQAHALGELGGVMCLYLEMKKIDYVKVAPTLLKKYVSGTGMSKKDLLIMNVYKRFGIETRNSDEADAVGLAFLGCSSIFYAKGVTGNTKKDIECFDKFLSTELAKKGKNKSGKKLFEEVRDF